MIMKNLLLLFALALISLLSSGQQLGDYVVAPGDPGVLNAAVVRYQDSVTYVLKRGEYYFLTEKISTQFPLHIKAEEGSAARPIIQCLPDQEGINFALFSLGGNTLFENLYLTGYDALGNIVKNIIRLDVAGIKFKMENCFVDYDQQCPTRINVENVTVHYNNCTIRNIANVNDPNNGRLVDTRSNSTDSVIITNSTLYHASDYPLRTAGGALKYFEFDHNTLYMDGEGFDIGIIKKVKITNNILYNIGWQAGDSLPNVDYFFNWDSVGNTGDFSDAEREFDLSNNNLYVEQYLIDIINSGKRTNYHLIDSIGMAFIAAEQCDTTDLISEKLVFDNLPPRVDAYLQIFHDNYGILDAVEVPNFYADDDFVVPGESNYTFNYVGALSSVGSDTNGPLGDPRWTGTAPTSVPDYKSRSGKPVVCFPVPASDILNLQFSLSKQANVTVRIFDILGRNIMSVENIRLQSGQNTLPLNIGNIDAGPYLYKLYIDNAEFDSGRIIIQ